jgi:hypothetical protein
MCRHICSVAFSVVVFQYFTAGHCQAQIGYGVNGTGQLFRFFVNATAPAPVTNIGAPLSFVPEGIDFRPSSQTLYAIDVGPNTTQLYTIDIDTGVATAVGPGFNSTGVAPAPYNLTTSTAFGFDFNPKTLQGDGSMRIRLVNTANQNLRLNSSTGLIANVDSQLVIPPEQAPFVDAVAYINNIAETPGPATTLYDMDTRNDSLYTQDPPNNGTLNLVGAFGAGIDATIRVHFDIFTDLESVDSTIGGDFGYAVLKRPDTPPAPGPTGSYLLYNVNLATGQTVQGRLVGSSDTPANFDGGFAVLPFPIPEPSGASLAGVVVCAWVFARGKRLS